MGDNSGDGNDGSGGGGGDGGRKVCLYTKTMRNCGLDLAVGLGIHYIRKIQEKLKCT